GLNRLCALARVDVAGTRHSRYVAALQREYPRSVDRDVPIGVKIGISAFLGDDAKGERIARVARIGIAREEGGRRDQADLDLAVRRHDCDVASGLRSHCAQAAEKTAAAVGTGRNPIQKLIEPPGAVIGLPISTVLALAEKLPPAGRLMGFPA